MKPRRIATSLMALSIVGGVMLAGVTPFILVFIAIVSIFGG